jgi:hypothetical protein
MFAEQFRAEWVADAVLVGAASNDRSAELQPGSHVLTPRRGFLHHGIYVGNGNVVHYAGSTHGLVSGPIEEVALDRFSCGRPVRAVCQAPAIFSSAEVILRAKSRVGENHYRLISNNCEHFCEWCLRGDSRSYQVEAWLALPGRALQSIARFWTRPNEHLFPR